jgi:hypothetical protein
MNFGAYGGTFSGNFIDLQKDGVTKFKVENTGKVAIGTSTYSNDILTVAGDIRVGTTETTGCINNVSGGNIMGTCSSDQRLKDNIQDIPNVLDKITSLRVVNFNWNQVASTLYGNSMSALQTGYVAQNVESIFPELIHINKEGYKQVNYTALGIYAVEGVKELALKEASTTAILSRFASTIDVRNAPTSTPSITIDSSGYVGLGTTHPLVMLHVATTTATGTVARFENNDGYCDINPIGGLYCTTNESTRENISPLDISTTTGIVLGVSTSTESEAEASTTLEKIKSLTVITYTINSAHDTSTVASSTHTGLSMTEVKSLFPDLVATDINGIESISYTNFIPYILKSIKDLAIAISDMKDHIFTKNIDSTNISTKLLCVGDGTDKTCITKQKLDRLLLLDVTPEASASAPSSSPSIPSTGSSSTPPSTPSATSTDPTSTSTPSVENVPATGDNSTSTPPVVSDSAPSTPPVEVVPPVAPLETPAPITPEVTSPVVDVPVTPAP